MTDPSLFIRFGKIEVGAVGRIAIIAVVLLPVLAIAARWLKLF